MPQPNFKFESLQFFGDGKETAVVSFSEGINFIVGPSNTGKSLIVNSIDYAFGYIPDKKKPHYTLEALTSNGYDKISLTLRTENGTVILTRVVGKSKITVSGSDSSYEKGSFSISKKARKTIQPLLLQLLGIEEDHSIIASIKGKLEDVSFRSVLHFSLVRQQNIAHVPSIYINPDAVSFSQTSSPALLLFLLTGIDANDITTGDDPKIQKERKKAVAEYIRTYLESLSKRREELSGLPSVPYANANQMIASVESDIHALQTVIDEAVAESKTVMDEIYKKNSKMSELSTIRGNFNILTSQYRTDIGRLELVLQGHKIMESSKPQHICPFCRNRITDEEADAQINQEIRANLQHIRSHLTELSEADSDAAAQYRILSEQVNELENRKVAIDKRIDNELRPRLGSLQQQMHVYKSAAQVARELEVILREETRLKGDLFKEEQSEDEKPPEYHILNRYTHDIIAPLEKKIESVLGSINFPGYDAMTFNMESFDIMIGNQTKAGCQGGGYTAVINAAMIIGLMEHLIDYGKYAPGYAVLDSPLTQLSESKYKDAISTIKRNFMDYLFSTKTAGQIILVEQYEKLASILDDIRTEDGKYPENVNVIEFTGDTSHGTYGLLPGVTNPGTRT